MQIACPNCSATYQVSATAIGTAGRQVRCVRCRTVWHQDPMPEVPPLALSPGIAGHPTSDDAIEAFKAELGGAGPPAPAAAVPAEEPAAAATATPPQAAVEVAAPSQNGDPSGPSLADLIAPDRDAQPGDAPPDEAQPAGAETAAPSLSDIEIPVTASPPTAPAEPGPDKARGDVEAVARRRRRSAARRRLPMRPGATPILIVVLACMIGALLYGRAAVVRHAPQMASLYAAIGLPVNLRGLEFSAVQVSRETHDGVTVLVVEGTIANALNRPAEVPRLRFAMRNEAGGEIYAWTAMPTKEALAPGETLAFRSRLASPPGEGRDVTVRFFTRLDAIAGLR